ncbi:unnamed protein product [Rotaria sp. Silwood2]|nr:unnamed protein product [Rotaria sp. Silwood2]
MKNLSTSILFGRLMCDMGQWNQSQHFFEHLLNNSNIYNEDLTKIECSLGEVLQWKGEWNEARKYYDRAYDRIMNVKPTRIKDSADILLNIGKIFYLEGKYEEVGDYYEQALAMREENYSFTKINNPCAPNRRRRNVLSRIRASFQSVLLSSGGLFHPCSGRLWTRKFRETSQPGKYDEALDFHRRALALQEKYYPSHYGNIANTLNHIFGVLFCQSKYGEALCYCQRVLTMQESYYLSGNASIAPRINNIGNILYQQGKYDEAVDIFRRALSAVEKHSPCDHFFYCLLYEPYRDDIMQARNI